MTRARAYLYLSIFLIALLALAVYAEAFHSPFLFDDFRNIVQNRYLSDISNIPGFFSGKGSHPLRALTSATLALNYHFGGLETAGYHAVNILLHMFNGILVFLLIRKILSLAPMRQQGRPRVSDADVDRFPAIPLFAALLFIAHPVQTMGVTYIIQRAGQLATCFYLLIFLAFIQGSLTEGKRKGAYYLLACLMFFCAMWSKEIAVTAPLLLLIFHCIYFRRPGESLSRTLRPFLPIFAILLVLIAYALYTLDIGRYIDIWLHPDPNNESMARWLMGQNLLTQFNVIISYVALLFYPTLGRLNADRSFPLANSLFELPTGLSFIAIVALLILAWRLSRHRRMLSFGIFWFLIALLPDSSVIPLADIMVDYRLYLPGIGFFMVLVDGLHWLAERLRTSQTRRVAVLSAFLVPALLVPAILFCAVTARERNVVYGDSITFWADAAVKSPDKSRPFANLGKVLYESGRVKEAIKTLKRAIQIDPTAYIPHFNLATLHHNEGSLAVALAEYRTVVKLRSDHTDAHHRLGMIHLSFGFLEEAAEHFQKAGESEPENAGYPFLLAQVYEKMEKFKEAEEAYKEALRLNPDYEGVAERLQLVREKSG